MGIEKMIIAMLEKDDDGVPTYNALKEMMQNIDEGVAKSNWSENKRKELLGRLQAAALAQFNEIKG